MWCDAGGDDKFCFAPFWSGAFNCPCDQSKCFSYYGCPSGTREVFCGSKCEVKGTECAAFVPAGSHGSLVSFSAALLLLASVCVMLF